MSESATPPNTHRFSVGDEIDPSSLPITYRRMIVNVASSWDLFPGHYDPEYARAHGHPTVFANTSLFLAFVDRTITDWSGPRTHIMAVTDGCEVSPDGDLVGALGRWRRRVAPHSEDWRAVAGRVEQAVSGRGGSRHERSSPSACRRTHC